MTAHEKQDERVVMIRFLLGEVWGRYGTDWNRGGVAPPASQLAAHAVGPPEGDLSQPGSGIVRKALPAAIEGPPRPTLPGRPLRRQRSRGSGE